MDKDIKFLHGLGWQGRAAGVLQVVERLDIFTHLSETRMSAGQLAVKTQTKPDIMAKLLIVCCALGLLEKQGDNYYNSRLAQRYLVKGAELYQGDIIQHHSSLESFWGGLDDKILLEDTPMPKRDEHRDFIMAMHNIAVTGRAELFLDNIDLSGRKILFDVGGGPGTYSIAACRRYPKLKAVVFDLPETIAITKEMIVREGMEKKVSVREGDWNSDDFGQGNDVVLLSEVMHGAMSNAEMKLQKAYDSLVDNGLVVIQDFLLNDEKNGPLVAALFNLMAGAYSKTELMDLAKRAGFRDVKLAIETDDFGAGWITGVK